MLSMAHLDDLIDDIIIYLDKLDLPDRLRGLVTEIDDYDRQYLQMTLRKMFIELGEDVAYELHERINESITGTC